MFSFSVREFSLPGAGGRARWQTAAGVAGLAWAGFCAAAGALTPAQRAQLPAPAAQPVQFARDIKPILEAACSKCHGGGRAQGGFRLDTRETTIKGGKTGPAAVPGNSAESYLVELVSGLNPDAVMPRKGTRLKPAEVGLLRAWIDQGLPWDQAASLGRKPARNLRPHQPPLPDPLPGAVSAHPVDLFVDRYLADRGLQPGPQVPDGRFARRAWLDVLGLLPPPAELAAFEADPEAGKRERLVRSLLNRRQRYAEHWLSFWNDALRNDYQGPGYIDGGRTQITPWLFEALASNKPYDQFVRELVNPAAGAEGFTRGIVWRGVVNASQTPYMQAAQNISQVFLGINLKCASCHDSFVSDWTLADSYGLASVYAEEPLEMVHCDRPTGQKAAFKFLYPELGGIDPGLARPERLRRLAELMTHPGNHRLARTMVNRLWARFFGRGLVEPVDEMDSPAWHQDLLDWLAADFAGHGYDLHHAITRLLTSHAYQRAAVNPPPPEQKEYEFHGPLARRLSAEQFLDGLAELAGGGNFLPANARVDLAAAPAGAGSRADGAAYAQARWIGLRQAPWQGTNGATIHLARKLVLPAKPAVAVAVCAARGDYTLHINGQAATRGGGDAVAPWDCLPFLKAGENILAVTVTLKSPASAQARTNPPAWIGYFAIQGSGAADGSEAPLEVVSDPAWLAAGAVEQGWEQSAAASASWPAAGSLAGLEPSAGGTDRAFLAASSGAAQAGHIRHALVPASPLLTALGRPNREQTVTRRLENATTLQALELIQGPTLAALLRRGAGQLLARAPAASPGQIQQLFRHALSRNPAGEELALLRQAIGSPPSREGWEDGLWAVLMLPEFQYIY